MLENKLASPHSPRIEFWQQNMSIYNSVQSFTLGIDKFCRRKKEGEGQRQGLEEGGPVDVTGDLGMFSGLLRGRGRGKGDGGK